MFNEVLVEKSVEFESSTPDIRMGSPPECIMTAPKSALVSVIDPGVFRERAGGSLVEVNKLDCHVVPLKT